MQPPDKPISSSAGLRTTRRLALYGASVRAAAQSAALGGFAVTGIDRFGDLDTLDACEQHLLLDKKAFGIGGNPCVSAGFASSTEKALQEIAESMPMIPVGGLVGDGLVGDMASFVARLPAFGLWPDQRGAADKVRSLDCLRRITSGTSFQVPTTRRVERNADVTPSREGLAGNSGWLQKSFRSSGGLGTCWTNDVPGKTTVARSAQYLQRWVPGKLYGATLISNGIEAVLLGVCRSRFTRIGPFPFLYAGSLGPIEVGSTLRRQLEQIGSRVVATSGVRGLFNLDFIVGPGSQLWLLEINPRWSGSSELIERHIRRRRPGFSLMSIAVNCLSGSSLCDFPRKLAIRQENDPIYYKRIVFACRDLTFDYAAAASQLRANESLHDLPPGDRPIRQGEPVCTLITQWKPHEACAGQEKSPMLRHRALVRSICGSGGKPEST